MLSNGFSFSHECLIKAEEHRAIEALPVLVVFDVVTEEEDNRVNWMMLVDESFMIDSALIGVFALHKKC